MQGNITLNLTLTAKQAVELLELLKDEADWGYGLSPDLEALRRQLREKLKDLRAQGGVIPPFPFRGNHGKR